MSKSVQPAEKPSKKKDLITGKFIFNGGKKSELRDKKCPLCPLLIMRKSSTCRSCHQLGSKSSQWKDAKPKCPECGKKKANYTRGLCRNCFRGDKHFGWKGNNVGYGALHDWVRAYKGNPTRCSKDSSHKGPFHWSNKSGEYKRDLTDWQSLCVSCNFNDGIKINQRFRKEFERYGRTL